MSTISGNFQPLLDDPFIVTEKGNGALALSEDSCRPLPGPFLLHYYSSSKCNKEILAELLSASMPSLWLLSLCAFLIQQC